MSEQLAGILFSGLVSIVVGVLSYLSNQRRTDRQVEGVSSDVGNVKLDVESNRCEIQKLGEANRECNAKLEETTRRLTEAEREIRDTLRGALFAGVRRPTPKANKGE